MHDGFERKSLTMAAMLIADAMGTREALVELQRPGQAAYIEWPLPNGSVVRLTCETPFGLAAYLKKGQPL